LLLKAAADQAAGRPAAALARLGQVVSAPKLRDQAVRRLLALLGRAPQLPGGLAALDAVPEACRDDGYWTIRGSTLLGGGEAVGAFEAWARIRQRGPALGA